MPVRVLLLVLATALVGCGAELQRPIDAGAPVAPGPLTEVVFAQAGVRVSVPSAWTRQDGPAEGPLLATFTSGRATIALWRYPRVQRLPRTTRDLRATRDSLVAAAKARDTTFAVLGSTVLRDTRRRGVELTGNGTNAGVDRRIRSTHLFAAGAEVVLDQYTTPEAFGSLDASVFAPAARSLGVFQPTP